MIVTEAQIVIAMKFFEARHVAEVGPLDKVNLPGAVSKLADLLGAMWFERETETILPDSSKFAVLLREALMLPEMPGRPSLPELPEAGLCRTLPDGVAAPPSTDLHPPQAAETSPSNAPAASPESDDAPLVACPLRDNGDVTCDVCQ